MERLWRIDEVWKSETSNQQNIAAEKLAHDIEGSSPTLQAIDNKYPGLSQSSIYGVRFSRFVACADTSNQIKEFQISRDRSGVHMRGLFRDQDFSADFIDTGNALQIIGATLGGAIATDNTGATGLFSNISAAITDHCPSQPT
jgi:hypothetical protein